MESAFIALDAKDDGPRAPACPRCERRDEIVPTFDDLDDRGGLPWLCARCDLRFFPGQVYL